MSSNVNTVSSLGNEDENQCLLFLHDCQCILTTGPWRAGLLRKLLDLSPMQRVNIISCE